MRLWIRSLLFLCCTFVFVTSLLTAQRIQTEAGIVEGKTSGDGKVQSFLGIPYAAPPVGPLRWKEPQPASPWEGVRKATDFGARCMQAKIYDDMVFLDAGPSEDCLYLNVWTPNTSSKAKLPVMVWIYGGGFKAGATSEPRQNGEYLAHRGVVVVSMNYRLGIFGFFSHPDLTKESPHHASGNYGLMDQSAALRWVKKNIAAFGGDPDNVTIFGESAGSYSVCAQMASPLSKNLIRRAIGESGALLDRIPKTKSLVDSEHEGTTIAQQLGADSLAKLRALPAQQLLDSATKNDKLEFRANVDGYFLPVRPAEIYAKSEQANVPLLAGWNRDEGSYQGFFDKEPVTKQSFIAKVTKDYGESAPDILRAFPAVTEEQIKQSAAILSGADFIGYGTWKWLELHQASDHPAYRFRFDQMPPLDPAFPDRATVQSAYHSAEIEYVFGTLDWKKLPWTEADRRVSDLMQIYWVNFARTGDPNGKNLPKWAPYNPKTGFSLMYFAQDSKAAPDDQREQYLAIDTSAQHLPATSNYTPNASTSTAAYPNTTEGLQFFLMDILGAARTDHFRKVSDLIKQTEIPSYRDWFQSMYPADTAESWIAPYGKNLESNETALKDKFVRFAMQDGEIFVRKVSGDPERGNGLEWAMLTSPRKPLDVYLATWGAASSAEVNREKIGYFMYIGGRFRWNSLIRFVTPVRAPVVSNKTDQDVELPDICTSRTGTPFSETAYKVGEDVSAPRALRTPDPEYSEQARKKKFQGSTQLSLIVDADGCPRNVAVVRPLGHGLDEKAIEAIGSWRFSPAMKKGKPVPVTLDVQMSFRLY